MAINETSNTPGQAAVAGINTTTGDGIWGQCDAGRGVVGVSKSGSGVWGATISSRAVVGANDEEGTGVWGETKKGRGVVGIVQTDGDGTWGQCDTGRGVVGVSKSGSGVWGETTSGRAVVGVSATDIGVFGKGGRLAGFFEGNVDVTGSLTVQGTNIGGLAGRIQAVEALAGRVQALEGIAGRVQNLEQKIAALESQVNTAVSNLTGRITQAELAISDLKFKVQQLGG